MQSPYESLPREAFWRTGVVGQEPTRIGGLYKKKFSISKSAQIATAGSCFAQHISKYLRARQFSVLDVEPTPPGLDSQSAAEFGYGLYSARYANIYTSRQLLQLVREASGEFNHTDPVWEKNGRYYDSMRPSVEPGGLPSPGSVAEHRKYHLAKVCEVLQSADVFVFTLGLTETWAHVPSGAVFPTAPGTIAGTYDPDVYRFHNLTFVEIYDDMSAFFTLVEKLNPQIKFLLTVSPVPLTATASGSHVLSATIYSKSVLRAVAGQLCIERDNVDYFPSYEIITGALSKGRFFEDNLRSVKAEGVEAAMTTFLAEHDTEEGRRTDAGVASRKSDGTKTVDPDEDDDDDVVCEEVLLDAFAR